MKKGWTTTDLIVVGSLAALQIVITIPIRGLVAATGTNPLSAIFYLITGPIFAVITLLLVPKFSSITIKNIIVTIIGIPFPKVYPVPFCFLEGPLVGLILDVSYLFLKRRKRLAAITVGGIASFFEAFFLYLIYLTIGYAQAKKLPSFLLESIKILPRVILIFAILIVIGAGSGYLGYLIFERIKNTTVVRRIQQA